MKTIIYEDGHEVSVYDDMVFVSRNGKRTQSGPDPFTQLHSEPGAAHPVDSLLGFRYVFSRHMESKVLAVTEEEWGRPVHEDETPGVMYGPGIYSTICDPMATIYQKPRRIPRTS